MSENVQWLYNNKKLVDKIGKKWVIQNESQSKSV